MTEVRGQERCKNPSFSLGHLPSFFQTTVHLFLDLRAFWIHEKIVARNINYSTNAHKVKIVKVENVLVETP